MSSVSLPSLNDLRTTLIRRGIPPRYAQRVTAELTDHAEDLAERGDGADERLGDLSQLADEITHTFRRRTFAGRHPWLMFVVLPFPLAIFACIAVLMAYFGSIMLVAKSLGLPADVPTGPMAAILRIVAVILPTASCAGVTWFLCRSAQRAGYRWTRAVAACLPVLLFAAHTYSVFRPDPSGQSDGLYQIGFFIPFVMGNSLFAGFGWQQLLQTLVPLLVIGGMMAREARKQPYSLVAEAG
ncbi:MAG: hypothetical protein AB7U20_13920 [Planctomycetaceae bacterium]